MQGKRNERAPAKQKTKRERERKEKPREFLGENLRELRCVIEGRDWVPYIVKWTAQITLK